MTTFIARLNQLLASANEDGWLAGLCDLLRMQTAAYVCITARDGRPVAEALPQDGMRPSANAYMITLPVMSGETTLGSLILSRDGQPFNETDNQMANIILSICTLLFRQREQHAAARRKQRLETVRSAINALSFSELEAAIHIIQAINGPEGRLVAGHTADKLGFTRSVVVNALKKLEGAGVIETRSLGVKGTHIRVKNQTLAEELNKL